MLVAFVEVVFCLDLGCELAVESVVHHPPWNTLRNHKWDSVLMETVRLKWLKHWFEKKFFLAEGGKKLITWNEKEELELTGSQKAQSQMMVAKALLSWLPWTMTTRGSEIIYNQRHLAWIWDQTENSKKTNTLGRTSILYGVSQPVMVISVEKNRANFSSVTDSVPFLSALLIFLMDCENKGSVQRKEEGRPI